MYYLVFSSEEATLIKPTYDCPICYKKISNNDKNYRTSLTLPCTHIFCTKCWINCVLEKIKQCPLCRNPQFREIFFNLTYSQIQNLKNYSPLQLSFLIQASAKYGNAKLCKSLIQIHHLNINFHGKSGWTPIQIAIISKLISPEIKFQFVQTFIENINMNLKNLDGITIFHLVASFAYLDILKLLFDTQKGKHIYVDHQDYDGNTMLNYLVGESFNQKEDEKLKCLKFLIEKKKFKCKY